jgi:ADP-ribosylglycohydrolase
MVNKQEKIEAAIMLLSYLETVGFYNGKWEFNYNIPVDNINNVFIANYTMVMEYMSLGGFNNLSIKNWDSSDDTILMIGVIKALLKGGKEIDFIEKYIEIYKELSETKRISGKQTLKSIDFLKKIIQKKSNSYVDKIPFENNMGGNGAAIRSGPIGLFYAKDIDKLISVSIMSSRLTHNIPIGYLGGLVSALFASYAYLNISPLLWINKLLELYESNKIQKYINSTNIGKDHDELIDDYFKYWYKYREKRFEDLINARNKSTFIFAKQRYIDLSEFIPKEYFNNAKTEKWYLLGASGLDSVIYAYDALLMSIKPNDNFEIKDNNLIYNPESLVFFGALHIGDNDSTGAIAGFWYGLLNGYGGFDNNKMKELEFYKELTKLSNNVNSLL